MRIAKGGNAFCYPEHIDREMRRLFTDLTRQKRLRGLAKEAFAAKAAHFLAELNAIHPFREGNGRAQLSFLVLLSAHVGHPLDPHRVDPTSMLKATIDSFAGDERPLARVIFGLVQDA